MNGQKNSVNQVMKTTTFLVDMHPLAGVKRVVFIKVVFLKLGEIDTVKEKYQADVFIQARWREPLLDITQDKNVDFTKYWNPKLFVQNLIDQKIRQSWREVEYGKCEEAYIVEKYRLHGHFSEKLELHEFPFDSQYLNLSISSELGTNVVDIVEDDHEISSINMSCFIDEQEWSLYDFVSSIKHVTTKVYSRNNNEKYPVLSFGCCAARRSGFFVWNMILIMALISLLSFATFAVSRTLTQNRLQLSMTLMLTGIAFRFATNQNLPRISYLTYMDKFISYNLGFTFSVCMWHAIVSRFEYDLVLQEQIDHWAFVALVIIYLLFNITFFAIITFKYLARRTALLHKERRYEEHATKLLGESWKSQRHETKIKKKTTVGSKVADSTVTEAWDYSYTNYSEEG